jgi:hypothetical protein
MSSAPGDVAQKMNSSRAMNITRLAALTSSQRSFRLETTSCHARLTLALLFKR